MRKARFSTFCVRLIALDVSKYPPVAMIITPIITPAAIPAFAPELRPVEEDCGVVVSEEAAFDGLEIDC